MLPTYCKCHLSGPAHPRGYQCDMTTAFPVCTDCALTCGGGSFSRGVVAAAIKRARHPIDRFESPGFSPGRARIFHIVTAERAMWAIQRDHGSQSKEFAIVAAIVARLNSYTPPKRP